MMTSVHQSFAGQSSLLPRQSLFLSMCSFSFSASVIKNIYFFLPSARFVCQVTLLCKDNRQNSFLIDFEFHLQTQVSVLLDLKKFENASFPFVILFVISCDMLILNFNHAELCVCGFLILSSLKNMKDQEARLMAEHFCCNESKDFNLRLRLGMFLTQSLQLGSLKSYQLSQA